MLCVSSERVKPKAATIQSSESLRPSAPSIAVILAASPTPQPSIAPQTSAPQPASPAGQRLSGLAGPPTASGQPVSSQAASTSTIESILSSSLAASSQSSLLASGLAGQLHNGVPTLEPSLAHLPASGASSSGGGGGGATSSSSLAPLSLGPPAAPTTSAQPNQAEHLHHQHNQSPVTIFSAQPRPFRPDRLATIDLIIVVVYLCLLLSTSISVSNWQHLALPALLEASERLQGVIDPAEGRR